MNPNRTKVSSLIHENHIHKNIYKLQDFDALTPRITPILPNNKNKKITRKITKPSHIQCIARARY